jgi:hypothetical protein
MWDTVAKVGSGLTLVAFIVASAYGLLRRRLLSSERQLLGAPKQDRAALIQSLNDRFLVSSSELDPGSLPPEQRYNLLLEQIRDRAHRFYVSATAVAVVTLALAGVTGLAILKAPQDLKTLVTPGIEEGKRREEVAKLAAELSYRIEQIHRLAGRLISGQLEPADQVGHAVLLWRVVSGDKEFQPTAAEYRLTNIVVLVTRLKLLGLGVKDADRVMRSFAYLEDGKDSTWHYAPEELQRAVDDVTAYGKVVETEAGKR